VQQQPHRAEVGAQLYRMGKQMPGGQNMFGGFGPQEAPPTDPFALLSGAAEAAPEAQPMLRAQPGPQMGPMPQGPAEGPKPPDRFPRLSRLMGRPILPEPKQPKKR
jgi:hypothetical protein